MYRINAILTGMRPVPIPCHADFSLDKEAFLAAIREHDPALVYIAYPNNPTGLLFDTKDIEDILHASRGVVVLDEAYHVFAKKSFMSRLPEFPNLIVLRTVSKLGLAGLRLGYLAARSEWVVQFNKVRQAYNVGVLVQASALYLLDRMDEFEAMAAKISSECDHVRKSLQSLPGVTVFPSAANFYLVRVPNAVRAYEGLKDRGVLVRNFHGAHPLLENCLRITVGTPDENRLLISSLGETL